MSNTWQSVILSVEDDYTTARSVLGFKCSTDAVRMWCDPEAQVSEECNDVVVGLIFFETEFWILMYLHQCQP